VKYTILRVVKHTDSLDYLARLTSDTVSNIVDAYKGQKSICHIY